MAQQRLPVRKIREVLQLKAAGFSDRKIAATISSARSTMQECVRRAQAAGISWPLTEELDESTLRERRSRKLWVFQQLMATRATRLSTDHVQSLT